jgi:HAD superfamily hydrolase (TIGR01509 family)
MSDSSQRDSSKTGDGTGSDASDTATIAVCFDMDGVLVDSEDYWHPAERERILPEVLDGEIPDLDEITGMNYREIYDYLDEHYETAVPKAEFVRLYDETARKLYGEQVRLLPGTAALLATLRERGVRTAVVSSSPPAWIETVLARFDLSFDAIHSADEFDGPGKPEPGVYEAAIADLGATPETTVVVEDSANGVRAGALSGATVIAFRDDHNAEADLSPADEIVESAAELREAVLAAVERLSKEHSTENQ